MPKNRRNINERIGKLENKAGEEWHPLEIIWTDVEAGEKMEPPEPGTLIIYWDPDDEIGSYRYDPTKPNGGKRAKRNEPKKDQ